MLLLFDKNCCCWSVSHTCAILNNFIFEFNRQINLTINYVLSSRQNMNVHFRYLTRKSFKILGVGFGKQTSNYTKSTVPLTYIVHSTRQYKRHPIVHVSVARIWPSRTVYRRSKTRISLCSSTGGRVREQGNHQQLVAMKGAYYELISKQNLISHWIKNKAAVQ
jgi:hypothetical protein